MFKKDTKIIKVKSELKKSKSLEDNLPTQLTIKNAFHNDVLLKAKLETCHDLITSRKLNFEDKLSISAKSIKKGEEIEHFIKDSKQNVIQKALNTAKYTFTRALRHYCFYDIMEDDQDKVTIIFLPISTSDKKFLCGIQKFDKALIHSNEINSIYITRLLFQKTMSRLDYDNWVNSPKYKYEGDINARKIIFEKIQQDLELHQYSVLKDSDILEPTTDVLTKELPLIKFKFKDLEF